MKSKFPFPSMVLNAGTFRFLLLLFTLFCDNTQAKDQDIDIVNCPSSVPAGAKCPDNANQRCYAAKINASVSQDISVIPPPSSGMVLTWKLINTNGCSGNAPKYTCAGIDVHVPADSDKNKVHIGDSTPTAAASSQFSLTVSDTNGNSCPSQVYKLRVTTDGGGWGDPHITTVDGIKYDFQSAGEFTALRGDGMEIQTRQTPVATSSPPGFTNEYTGLTSCVSIYTAVAARVGSHRVSYQPAYINGIQDPKAMKLRVDDNEIPFIPQTGIELSNVISPTHGTKPPRGDRIMKSSVGDGIEIHYVDGTKLVATPAYWDAQKTWYLNVNVYNTTASEGIMGKRAEGSWLPALPNGASLGLKPDNLHERYVALYDKFANAWRVTDGASLFYYEKGTPTATFNQPSDWPRENPRSCAIESEPSAQPVEKNVAEQHCKGIVDPNIKANCIFDVSVTGHIGFADTYKLTEKIQKANASSGWGGGTVDNSPPEENNPTTDVDIEYYWFLILLIIFILLFFIIKNKNQFKY